MMRRAILAALAILLAAHATAGAESIELTEGTDEGRRSLVGWLLRQGCGSEDGG